MSGDFGGLRYVAAMSPDPNAPPHWTPKADVFVNADGDFVIKMEIGGLTKEDIDLTMEQQRLTMTGSRADADAGQAHYIVRELGDQFQTVIEVPWGFDLTNAKAAYQNGMLRIVVPPNSSRR
jgi:HSP20 family protein